MTDQLTKRWGRKTAVDGISLQVPEGSIFGIVGPNGAGKTTLLNMMGGFLRPSSGSAQIFGIPVSDFRGLKGKVGMMPQDTPLPAGLKVGQALQYYCRLGGLDRGQAREEASRVLRLVSLAGTERQRIADLSHGFRKRINLAQSFIGEPQLLILDEPTSGLDPASSIEIRALIARSRGSKTILISSHNLKEMEEIGDLVAILRSGRVVASGSMAEIRGSEHEIIVRLSNPPVQPQVLTGLRSLGSIESALAEGKHIRVRFDPERSRPEAMMAEVLRLLGACGVEVESVSKGVPLEERFMEITAGRPNK